MSIISPAKKTPRRAEPAAGEPLSLHNGDRMKQPEFHRRYRSYPEDVKFELVGGIVYMSSPLKRRHGKYHVKLSTTLDIYESGTPGVEVLDNTTNILGEENEPQPDLALRILMACGGQSIENEDDYVEGASELVAEIAHSSRSLHMHAKLDDYRAAGVIEYLVLCVEEQEINWFHFSSGKQIKANRDGIMKSKVFPGLWIDRQALLDRKTRRLIKVVRQGLASKEHAAFVKRLEKAGRK